MKKITATLMLAIGLSSYAQQQNYTEQDSLRGSITPERSWWDLNFYNLSVEVKPDEKFISGSNIIRYTVLEERQRLQVDLQPPLIIEKITQEGENLEWESNGNAHFVTLKKPQLKGEINEIKVYYSGHPKEAVRAPWDGGFSWKKDNNGKHFVATSCQGLGASIWWPNKDHMYDEVDSMAINITTPKDLMDVSNGRLLKVVEKKDSKTYHWYVSNPINNYGVNINLGDYVHFGETYNGENGPLTMDYYVLRDNEEKAKEQFKQAPMMMEAFEYWFGPYPFYEDGYKLVEVPYLGMEHQSSVTYGNKYGNGYLGKDLSKSGWGLKFDFILIHESGHEWFANNITYKDIADMWVHEGFTAYSENLYVDYHFGKKASSDYVLGTRSSIQNDVPIIGTYNVNQKGSGDMYSKGANVLHTIRQLVDDDEKWRTILRGLNKEFYHRTVTTKQIEDYISSSSGIDLSRFFDQYLRTVKIPILEYQVKGKKLRYRYTNIIKGFEMPVKISINGTQDWVYPTSGWQSKSFKKDILSVDVDNNFYVDYKKI
ncbi:M1 family metallopeptidase [Arenibacter sp. ARW7G5Y1]|uniref:M1 family metallopeptidase n=1 Tax=Arenibacter sp. ARW7G5Y1 TaxID=2135619 RepID=UPI000D761107|nr:M1 family metallopeptidase [Arenibacter sp. ARW7G5Y1]PXX29844.1 peptidase M1-like protein [Arenibacter sp. ARW7G5Y1]|tara:strand:- start:22902 stop:24524 length:1623 start_codon:yes stop_codon:yes gene_type:complete